jgi:hypothetical protein
MTCKTSRTIRRISRISIRGMGDSGLSGHSLRAGVSVPEIAGSIGQSLRIGGVMATSGKAARALLGLTVVVVFIALALQLYLSVRLADATGKSAGYGAGAVSGLLHYHDQFVGSVCFGVADDGPGLVAGPIFREACRVGWVAASIAFVSVAYFLAFTARVEAARFAADRRCAASLRGAGVVRAF